MSGVLRTLTQSEYIIMFIKSQLIALYEQENLKDFINHCMTKHEVEIRKLAETPLGGPRFMSFIRRWEMNNEPPPKEEKIEKYVSFKMLPDSLLNFPSF